MSDIYYTKLINLPEPTKQEPLKQVFCIWDKFVNNYSNKQTVKNYITPRSLYVRFIKETYNFDEKLKSGRLFYLLEQWTPTAFQKAHYWAYNQCDDIGTHYKAGFLQALKLVMEYAFNNDYLSEPVLFIEIPQPVKETYRYKALSVESEKQFFNKLAPLISKLKNTSVNEYNFIDKEMIIPLLIKIIQITGLNAESVMSLRNDCLSVHPITNNHCIKFFKGRSKGANEFHLSILPPAESKELIQIIKKLVEINKKVVTLSSGSEENSLFLYQSQTNYELGKVRKLSYFVINDWIKDFILKNDVKDNSELLKFTLSRLRTTKATRLVTSGVDAGIIQSYLAHRSLKTTFSYIDKNQLKQGFHVTISSALEQIKNNILSHNESKNIQSFKTPVAECLNPFEPPESIKDTSFNEDKVCTAFSSCLVCPSVLINQESLKKLFRYRREIKIMLSRGIEFAPQSKIYNSLIKVLDNLLEPDSFFTKETLDEANALSFANDFVIDSFVYQGVIS